MSGLVTRTLMGLTVSKPTLYLSSAHHGVLIMFGSQSTFGSNFGWWGILNGSLDTRAPVSGWRCVFSYGLYTAQKTSSELILYTCASNLLGFLEVGTMCKYQYNCSFFFLLGGKEISIRKIV